MIEHTREPWTYEIQTKGAIIGGGPEEGPHEKAKGMGGFIENAVRHRLVASLSGSDGATKANARRIAAAVNACKDIPTEALEAGAVKDLRTACQRYIRQYRASHGDEIKGETPRIIFEAVAKAEGREKERA